MANSGRGWFGDSAGHSKAGRKGGRARAKNRSKGRSNRVDNLSQEDRNRGGRNSSMDMMDEI